jgi:hypothetical protein
MTIAYTAEVDLGFSGALQAVGGAIPEGLDPAEVLNSRPIRDIMALPAVPRNSLLFKGVLDCGGKAILLMDTRVDLSANGQGSGGPACVLFVDLDGVEIGLIVAAGPEA